MTLVEQIAGALLARIAAAVAPVPVYRYRGVPAADEVQVIVRPLSDAGETESPRARIARSARIEIAIVAGCDNAHLEADRLLELVHGAVQADRTQGVGCTDTGFPEIDWSWEQGQSPTALVVLTYPFTYRAVAPSLSVAG